MGSFQKYKFKKEAINTIICVIQVSDEIDLNNSTLFDTWLSREHLGSMFWYTKNSDVL